MEFNITDLKSGNDVIFDEVINSKESQLLIPPKFTEVATAEISQPKDDQKYVGLFSSGTTNIPKCIWNTYKNLESNALKSAEAFEIKSNHRLLILAKPWHVAGVSWVLMAKKLGCEFYFVNTIKGESKKWLEVINTFKPDYLLTVPSVFRAIYNKNWKVENIITGGMPLVYSDFQQLESHAEYVYQGYGQTEAGGLISCKRLNLLNKNYPQNAHQNCGTPIKGVQISCLREESFPSEIFIQSETAYTNERYNTKDFGYLKNNEIHLVGRDEEIVSVKE